MQLEERTVLGATLMALLMLMALSAPLLASSSSAPSAVDVQLWQKNVAPLSPNHLLGTDYLGRDILAEAMWGARASLTVGILAAGIAVTFGSLWGSVSALCGGLVDSIMMRIVDGLLAIPSLILVLAFDSLISAPTLASTLPPPFLSFFRVSFYSHGLLPLITVVGVVSATTWLEAARLSRAQVLSIKSQEYVTAARALGLDLIGMLRRHVLPNAAAVLIVELVLLVSDAVLLEAGLSFLGLGLGPSIPSWGGMLAAAQMSLIQGNWWAALVPGLLITATVLSVNLIGEGWLGRLSQPSLAGRIFR